MKPWIGILNNELKYKNKDQTIWTQASIIKVIEVGYDKKMEDLKPHGTTKLQT